MLREEEIIMVNPTDQTNSPDRAAGGGARTPSVLTQAWLWVALVPVFFLVAFAAQYAIYAMTGDEPGLGTAPLWVDLTAAVVGLVILLVPCVAGMVYGRRARRAGVRAGIVPEVVAGLLGVAAIVLVAFNV